MSNFCADCNIEGFVVFSCIRTCKFFFFFYRDTAPTGFYTLSLHDALPICGEVGVGAGHDGEDRGVDHAQALHVVDASIFPRSEEHTSELQSHHDLVCRLLLEKKKRKHWS